MLQPATLRFLSNLKQNNHKAWFENHRRDYEAAKDDFEGFVENVLKAHAKKDEDLSTLKPKECIFRINRDVRFSKDKTPYKTNLAASFSKGGKKSVFADYYIHCEPGQSFAGGGIWMPLPEEVKKIRQEIDYCFDEFELIVGSKKFRSVYGYLEKEGGIALVNVPKGYEKGNPAAEYLKLKSWVAIRKITDNDLTSKDLVKIVLEAFETLQPMIVFLNRALS